MLPIHLHRCSGFSSATLTRCAVVRCNALPRLLAEPTVRAQSSAAPIGSILSERQRARTLQPAFWRDWDLRREDVQPLCADKLAAPLVDALLLDEERALLKAVAARETVEADIAAFHGAFIDRMVLDAVGRRVRQIVLIGSGMDTRAYRLDVPPQLKVVEVDEAAVHQAKQDALRSAGARARCSVRSVATAAGDALEAEASLPLQDLEDAVDKRRPSLFVVDGYLLAAWQSAGVSPVAFAALASMAANGSRILAQVRPKPAASLSPLTATSVVASDGDAELVAAQARSALQEVGWERTDVVGAKALGRLFSRAPPPDAAGVLVVAEVGEASRPGRAPAERLGPSRAGSGGPREVGI